MSCLARRNRAFRLYMRHLHACRHTIAKAGCSRLAWLASVAGVRQGWGPVARAVLRGTVSADSQDLEQELGPGGVMSRARPT